MNNNGYSKGVFTVRIHPHTVSENNFCWIDLKVKYCGNYPNEMPELTLLKDSSKGISDENFKDIEITMKQ